MENSKLTHLLKASIDYEKQRSCELTEIKDVTITQSGHEFLKDQILMEEALNRIEKLKHHLTICQAYLDKFLDEFEAKFDNDERCDSHEIALDYLAAAKFRADNGRINNRIRAVQSWYDSADSLPFKKAQS